MKKHHFKWLSVILTFAFVLAACGGNNSGNTANNGNGNAEQGSQKITLAYVAWDSEIASTNVVREVLETKLNMDVEMLQVDAGPMWIGISDGSADAMVAGWLPTTHEAYYEDNEGDFEDLGPNLDGTKIGLVVPTYMDVNSIEDLATSGVGEELDYTITGIEPGAGIMMSTEQAMEEYGLDDWTLLSSSSAAMTKQLESSYNNQEPIIVTGWTPHWIFAKMDLKYLEDPKGIYGGAEQIHTIVRKGLKEDMPKAYQFLDQFEWTPADMESVMVEIAEGASPEEASAKWVQENEEKVNAWLEGIEL